MSGRRAITLVALREVRERLRSRAFLVSTLVLLLLVGASTAVPEPGRVGEDVPGRGHRAGTARTRGRASTRGAAVRRESSPSCPQLGGRRTRRAHCQESRRAAAPPRRPTRLPGQRGHTGCRGRRHGGACAPPSPAAGAGTHDRNARTGNVRVVRCRGPRRDARRCAPARDSCHLRAVGAHRCRRGEEQPGRRAHPLDGAAAPPARRQGDRDWTARARATDTRRRAGHRPPRRGDLRCSSIARR